MKAIACTERGGIETLKPVTVPKPSDPEGYDVLDYPDYYTRCPDPPHVLGFDGAGTILSTGPSVKDLKPGDDIFYSGSPIRQGSNAQYQLVDSRSVALKPNNLEFVQAAAMPLTYITAYEALVERLAITKGEDAGILIVNGAGGVGSVASQIARWVLELPVVVTTASREETQSFTKQMGATHVVNHREDIVQQIKDLNLKTPIRYVFITSRTEQYLGPAAAVLEPFGKICSIVQTQEFPQYGTEMMAKSLAFMWCLLGTKPYYGVQLESHGEILRELKGFVEEGKVKCHLKQRLGLNYEGLRKAHEGLESGKGIGKVGLSVDLVGERGKAFT
ncbi:hypothetical protein LTS18_008431 [Coniosporium uncinatum]|uniref:Uncharacterized protein n=1 Tax=Coniosporium uncinatum TaxID=93489 RepID=A0ACC3DAI2_9PEZI|nr:hypothetical protein LTS18_008431 [Coniosporium uncinatum]